MAALRASRVDRWQLKWQLALTRLAEFVGREGHALVPTKHVESGHNLGAWINTQRNGLRLGILPAEKLAQIDEIDPSWRKGKLAPWETTLPGSGTVAPMDYIINAEPFRSTSSRWATTRMRIPSADLS